MIPGSASVTLMTLPRATCAGNSGSWAATRFPVPVAVTERPFGLAASAASVNVRPTTFGTVTRDENDTTNLSPKPISSPAAGVVEATVSSGPTLAAGRRRPSASTA